MLVFGERVVVERAELEVVKRTRASFRAARCAEVEISVDS